MDGDRATRNGPTLSAVAFVAAVRAGSLPAGPRSELVAGSVRTPPPVPAADAAAMTRLAAALDAALVDRLDDVVVRPLLLLSGSDVLRPDVAVVRGGGRPRRGSAPVLEPAAVLLLAEAVRGRATYVERAPLYAAAGVVDVWLVDARRQLAEVLRSPWRGSYRSRTLWYPGEAVTALMLGVSVPPLE